MMSSEEFIDMEVMSPCSSSSSPSSSTKYREEFEFPLIITCPSSSSSSSSYSWGDNLFNSQKLDHQNSADDLFYQGKLLPLLHLQKNFINNNNYHHIIIDPSTNPNTPPESRRVSCDDLDLENDCFVEWSNEVNGFTHHRQPKKLRPNNWPKRLFYKLKASKAYLFFAKSATCSSNLNMAANDNNNKKKKKIPLRDLLFESHRKSFSGGGGGGGGGISDPASSLSSCSSSSTPCSSLVLKRRTSADPELESFIQGAIAHCKLSHNIN